MCATPSCRRPLQDLGFVEEKGQLYCEYCFEQYLAPPCSKCNGKIKGVSDCNQSINVILTTYFFKDCLKAIGKNFHPECFNCVYCGKLFGNNPFFLEDGNPYCEAGKLQLNKILTFYQNSCFILHKGSICDIDDQSGFGFL